MLLLKIFDVFHHPNIPIQRPKNLNQLDYLKCCLFVFHKDPSNVMDVVADKRDVVPLFSLQRN